MHSARFQEFRAIFGHPQRICWAVAEADGQRSICPIGWKMTTSFKPPMMAISVAPDRFTHELIERSQSFVLAWPGEDLAKATIAAGTRSGRGEDKFETLGLTARPGEYVSAPLVEECAANLECKLAGSLVTGDHTIFAGEVLGVWLHESPKRLLCQIGSEGGYDFLLEKGKYRFGVIGE